MKIIIVRNRNGVAAIHWPGVAVTALALVMVYAVVTAIFSVATGWRSPLLFLGMPVAIPSFLFGGIRKSLQSPLRELASNPMSAPRRRWLCFSLRTI